MPYSSIEITPEGDFFLDGRKILDGDKVDLRWPDKATVITTLKIIQGELRIVGAVHGVKCWIILDNAIKKQQIEARWLEVDK